MALIEYHFYSDILQLSTTLLVVLPERPLSAVQAGPSPRYPTLYLLHGLSDDHTIWQRRTSIERYAVDKEVAVVMPAVHRSFYTDMTNGHNYWTYVTEEVPSRVRDVFPLSTEREENFVAGLSMGGYGAFKMALYYPDRFAAAASLSGAMNVAEIANPEEPGWNEEMRTVFGDLDAIDGSENDLFFLAARVADSQGPQPNLFQWCGTEDFLYADNVKFRDFARTLRLNLTYSDGPGDHTWDQWDAQIQNVLDWLPLADN